MGGGRRSRQGIVITAAETRSIAPRCFRAPHKRETHRERERERERERNDPRTNGRDIRDGAACDESFAHARRQWRRRRQSPDMRYLFYIDSASVNWPAGRPGHKANARTRPCPRSRYVCRALFALLILNQQQDAPRRQASRARSPLPLPVLPPLSGVSAIRVRCRFMLGGLVTSFSRASKCDYALASLFAECTEV